jgi:hypothetical protein
VSAPKGVPKERHLSTYMEPYQILAVRRLGAAQGRSMAAYLRALVLDHLASHGDLQYQQDGGAVAKPPPTAKRATSQQTTRPGSSRKESPETRRETNGQDAKPTVMDRQQAPDSIRGV